MRLLRGLVASAPVLCLLAGACERPDSVPENAGEADEDVRALTREQIQEHAEAMSPEVAESLGIVDTTIRIESPMPAESIPRPEYEADSAL